MPTVERVAKELIDGLEECHDISEIIDGLEQIMKQYGLSLKQVSEMCWDDSVKVFGMIYDNKKIRIYGQSGKQKQADD